MSFKATLFILDKEYPLLDAMYSLRQYVDHTGRPKGRVFDGKLNLQFSSTKDDTILYDAMFSPTLMIKGYIRIYKRDGMSRNFDIEFANAYVIHLKEHFNSKSNQPLQIHLTISPQIQKIRGSIFELSANPSNPFTENVPITERETSRDLEIILSHFEDENKQEIQELFNGRVFLVIKTKNGSGKSTDIDLSNKEHDFIYKGKLLENDRLLDFALSGDLTKIELTVIDQQNTEQS